jgi:hypothetical protein
LFDIEGHQPSESILNVNNRVADIEVSVLRCRTNTFRFSMLKSYTILKVTLTFDIEGHVIHIGFDIGYYIALSQYYSLRSRQALSRLSRRVSAPRALRPLFAQFHSLLQRYLTRKGPSIAPHHANVEPVPSPTVGSRICCSFLWDLTPEAARNCRSGNMESEAHVQGRLLNFKYQASVKLVS